MLQFLAAISNNAINTSYIISLVFLMLHEDRRGQGPDTTVKRLAELANLQTEVTV